MENYIDNNNVVIGGIVVEEIEFSHEIFDEKFYRFAIKTKRLSDQEDVIPIIISERIPNIENIKLDKIVKIEGQFRSYNMQTEGKNKLVLSVFVKNMEFCDDESILNNTNLIGYICKTPVYRKTPLGREITDVLVAVNRTYRKSDYVPCILWGRNAKFCETLPVGTQVKLSGRIQSRTYEKKMDNGDVTKKVAYEISVSKFAKNEEE